MEYGSSASVRLRSERLLRWPFVRIEEFVIAFDVKLMGVNFLLQTDFLLSDYWLAQERRNTAWVPDGWAGRIW